MRRLWIGCSALPKKPDREVVVADWFQSTAPATRVLDTGWRMRDTTVARALGFEDARAANEIKQSIIIME